MKLITRTLTSVHLPEILEWAAQYEQNDRYPIKSPLHRFAVGFYQIHQGMRWNNGPNAHEAYVAAALHFILCAGLMRCPLETLLPIDWQHGCLTWPLDHKELLFRLSSAQQMLFYYARSKQSGYARASRYKEDSFARDISAAIVLLIKAVPSLKRSEALEDASQIMIGRL